MAAELARNTNGEAQMWSVLETPWHREGKVLTSAPDFETALTLAEFDYPMEKRPYFEPKDPSDLNKGFKESGGAHYIYRPDINKNLGSVGDSYEVVTNREAFEILKPLVDTKVLMLETGGVLRDGADAWLLGKWDIDKFGPDVQEVFRKDGGILPYATVMANHNGRRGIMLGCTSVRVVCANTLGAAESGAEGYEAQRWRTVAHRGDAKSKLVEAAQEVFFNVVANFEVIARQYRLLMATALNDEAFKRMVLDVLAPDPRENPKFNPDGKLAELVLARADKKRAEVTRLWTQGKGHTGEKNAWFALQAAVEALDFNKDLWPNRAGTWRTASLLTGTLGQMKNSVTDRLVNFATSA
jgi:phage/plasmid-like protein (TIGR03299 family)